MQNGVLAQGSDNYKKKKKKNYEGLDGRANSNETAYGNLSDEKSTKQS